MLLISSEKKTNVGNIVKQSGGWEFIYKKEGGEELVPMRENKHPKLLGQLHTESVKTSRIRIRDDNIGGCRLKGSGGIRDGVWLSR